MSAFPIPPEATGLCLYRLTRADRLIGCEAVQFVGGRDAVDTVLRRAAISGRVEVGGDIVDHFADVLDREGSIIGQVALDRKSYAALKTRWMRCRTIPDRLPGARP